MLVVGARRGDREQLPAGANGGDVLVGRGRPDARQVHVRVDEAGKDGAPGQLDDPIGSRRIAGADPLYVPAVDQHPLPQRGMPEGVDACGAEQGLHDVRMMPRRMSPAREGAPMAATLSSVPGAKVRRFVSFSRSPSSHRARVHATDARRTASRSPANTTSSTHRIGGMPARSRPIVRDGQDRLAHPRGRRGTDRDAPNAGVSEARELCDQRLGLAARPAGGHPDRGGTDRRVARGHVAHDDQARPRALRLPRCAATRATPVATIVRVR